MTGNPKKSSHNLVIALVLGVVGLGLVSATISRLPLGSKLIAFTWPSSTEPRLTTVSDDAALPVFPARSRTRTGRLLVPNAIGTATVQVANSSPLVAATPAISTPAPPTASCDVPRTVNVEASV